MSPILRVFEITFDSKVKAVLANHRCNLHIKTIIVLNMNTLCQKINEEFALQAMN